MAPFAVDTKGWHVPAPQVIAGCSGFWFGTIQGLTQLGWTGVTVPVGPFPFTSEAEGLNASAVAVALTVLDVVPQILEKKVGRLARRTCTVTIGFTPKAAGRVEQSVAPVWPPAA